MDGSQTFRGGLILALPLALYHLAHANLTQRCKEHCDCSDEHQRCESGTPPHGQFPLLS
jgi:hypothetical protein